MSKLEGTTGEHLLRNVTGNATIYWQCADKHRMLVEAIESQHK